MGYQTKNLGELLDQLETHIDAAALTVEEVVTDPNNPDDRDCVDNDDAIEDLKGTLKELRQWTSGFDVQAVSVHYKI